MYTGVDFFSLLGGGAGAPSGNVGSGGPVTASPGEEKMVDMVDAVMRDAQQTWSGHPGQPLSADQGRAVQGSDQHRVRLRAARHRAVLLSRATGRSTWIWASMTSSSDGSARPVISLRRTCSAHELGHHIQRLTGTESRVRQQQQSNPGNANELSVRLELQADCYAGVWGHTAAQPGRAAKGEVELDPGDVEEGAARRCGDRRRSPAEARHRPRHARQIHARFTPNSA